MSEFDENGQTPQVEGDADVVVDASDEASTADLDDAASAAAEPVTQDSDEAGTDAADTVQADTVQAGTVQAGDEPADEADPVEEMREALRLAPGEWYVVHSYAGYENKVKTNLESRITSLDMEDFIYQIEVPTQEITEVKNGKRQQVQ
ncbi:MAG TPA: transcription termination/antitermination NusG family protein, partial [Mycobacteriales bacterium]|nr:transcription termination/antitermination NusG family protein [Mycobacteriales bacterium]